MHGHVIKLKTQDATPDDLMTVRQFAEKRGCSKSYIYKLRDQQKIKFLKNEKKIKFFPFLWFYYSHRKKT